MTSLVTCGRLHQVAFTYCRLELLSEELDHKPSEPLVKAKKGKGKKGKDGKGKKGKKKG